MSSATIANQLAAKIAMSQAAEVNADGTTEKDSLGGGNGSRADLQKPSMMSVAESHFEEKDQVPISKTFGGAQSMFKATQSGLSQASLQFGKTVHNSNFKQVARSTIASVSAHVDAMPVPKKF